MSRNILSGGSRSQTYHFNLISIKKRISLLLGLTAANGFFVIVKETLRTETAQKMQSRPHISLPWLTHKICDRDGGQNMQTYEVQD
jgi:hypothetical protein